MKKAPHTPPHTPPPSKRRRTNSTTSSPTLAAFMEQFSPLIYKFHTPNVKNNPLEMSPLLQHDESPSHPWIQSPNQRLRLPSFGDSSMLTQIVENHANTLMELPLVPSPKDYKSSDTDGSTSDYSRYDSETDDDSTTWLLSALFDESPDHRLESTEQLLFSEKDSTRRSQSPFASDVVDPNVLSSESAAVLQSLINSPSAPRSKSQATKTATPSSKRSLVGDLAGLPGHENQAGSQQQATKENSGSSMPADLQALKTIWKERQERHTRKLRKASQKPEGYYAESNAKGGQGLGR